MNMVAKGRELGIGIRPRKMAEGRWVNTIVWKLVNSVVGYT
jgi:hypothetical protein